MQKIAASPTWLEAHWVLFENICLAVTKYYRINVAKYLEVENTVKKISG